MYPNRTPFLLITAIISQFVLTSCQEEPPNTWNTTELSHGSNVTFDVVSVQTNGSLSMANQSTSLEDTIVNFSDGAYTFVGRLKDNQDMPNMKTSDFLEILLRHLRRAPPTAIVAEISPGYHSNVKIAVTIPETSTLWGVPQLISAIAKLRTHFLNDAHTRSTIEITIASNQGARAVVKFLPVPTTRLSIQYGPIPGKTTRDSVDLLVYSDDSIATESAMREMLEAQTWFRRDLTKVIDPGFAISFKSANTFLTVKAAERSVQWAEINHQAVSEVLYVISEVYRTHFANRWSAFQAVLQDQEKNYQAVIQYLNHSPLAPVTPGVGSNNTSSTPSAISKEDVVEIS